MCVIRALVCRVWGRVVKWRWVRGGLEGEEAAGPWLNGHPTTTLRAQTAGKMPQNSRSMSLSHSHMVTSVVSDILPVWGAIPISNFPHVGGLGEWGRKSAQAPYIQ